MNTPGRINTRSGGMRPWAALAALCFLTIAGAVAQEKGQTPKPEGPAPEERPEEERVRLDRDYDLFKYIEDDAPIAYRGQKILDPKKDYAATQELKAYDYVLAFASKQKPELLAKYAARDVPYPSLFKGNRLDYLRELMHFEGRLALLIPVRATEGLRTLEKIDKLYEAWIYPKGHSEPLCLMVSELPEGVKPGEDININVAFDAYLFKLFHYESRGDKAGEAGKKQWRRAPLFLGKTFENKGSALDTGPTYTDNMLLTIVLSLFAVAGTVVLLGWWLKRGGRYVEEERKRRLEQTKFLEGSEG